MSEVGLRAGRILLAILCAVLSAPVAFAEAADPRIVLLTPAASTAAVSARLRAELEQLNIRVMSVNSPPATPSPQQLKTIAHAHGAFAAVHVSARGGGLDIWIGDRVTDKTVYRQIAEGNPDEIAFAAIELLRASLVEIHLPSERDEVEPATEEQGEVDAPVQALAQLPAASVSPRKSRAYGLGAGFAANLPSRGYPWHPSVLLQLSVELWQELEASALGLLAISTGEMKAAQGSARSSAHVVGAALGYRLGFGDRFTLRAGLGLGMARIHSEGYGVPPKVGTSDSVWTGLPYAQLSIGREVGARWRVGFDGILGYATNEPVVQVLHRTVGRWGRPLAVLAVRVSVDLHD